jgi:hypothetical protein
MERCGMRRVADAEADDQHVLGTLHREQRNVREPPHVPLREQIGGGHRVTVGQQHAPAVGRVRDGDHLGDAFAQRQQPLNRIDERASEHMV